MNKIKTKLIASLLSVLVAAAMIVVSSYAWLTISSEPEVGGLKIQIGSSNSIMLAADVAVKNGDGTVSHYPGKFASHLNFSNYDSYDYLSTLGSLTPISTYDGLHWVQADFYSDSDPEVQQGLALPGQMKPYAQLPVDKSLQYANLTEAQKGGSTKGCYVYLDFWVVSPARNCELRISTSNESNTGSFVIGQMILTPNADGTGYVLADGNYTAAASVRLGFLTNQENADYKDVQHYLGSDNYSESYTHLFGRFQEPGETPNQYSAITNRFTIYEPNGNLHTNGKSHYQITQPLQVQGGTIAPADISDRLTVQLENRWKMDETNEQTMLAREFFVATYGMQEKYNTVDALANYFYNRHLQGVYAPYVEKGYFVNSTKALYDEADANGIVPEDSVALHIADRATDEIVITKLQKNVPQRIRMFVWLEGQDADCVNFGSLSSFLINLEFAGNEM